MKSHCDVYLKYFTVRVSGNNISTNTMNRDWRRCPDVYGYHEVSDLLALQLLIYDRARTGTWLQASPREKLILFLHTICFYSPNYSAAWNWEAHLKNAAA
jgi:hypothetical protein